MKIDNQTPVQKFSVSQFCVKSVSPLPNMEIVSRNCIVLPKYDIRLAGFGHVKLAHWSSGVRIWLTCFRGYTWVEDFERERRTDIWSRIFPQLHIKRVLRCLHDATLVCNVLTLLALRPSPLTCPEQKGSSDQTNLWTALVTIWDAWVTEMFESGCCETYLILMALWTFFLYDISWGHLSKGRTVPKLRRIRLEM